MKLKSLSAHENVAQPRPPTRSVAIDTQPVLPEFVRLPKPGQTCPWTGLSRSKLNELILPCSANGHKPPVKSISLRRKGSNRGVRLIVLESLISFIKNQYKYQ